jgi:hypothetical protein
MSTPPKPFQAPSRVLARTFVAAALAACTALSAQASSVQFQATDLADTTPGQDLWQIDYTVNGPLGLFNGINLLFAPDRFADIAVVGNDQPDLIDAAPPVQPNAGLSADGQLTLTALQDLGIDFKGKLAIDVVWLGQGTPGVQPFEWLDPSFNVMGNGVTTPVPEPQAIVLAFGGLLVGAAALRRRGLRSRSAAPVRRPA